MEVVSHQKRNKYNLDAEANHFSLSPRNVLVMKKSSEGHTMLIGIKSTR